MRSDRIEVMVVEDRSIVQWALRRFLEANRVSVVACCTDKAVELAEVHRPDVVLIGLTSACGEVVEITKTLACGGSRVLGLSECDSADVAGAFLQAGGMGLVHKTSSVNELLTAINAVTDDRQWISPGICTAGTPRKRKKDKSALSSREEQVAILTARGFAIGAIAEKLQVSRKTADTFRYRIFKKLGIHNRAQLVEYVLKNDLIGHSPVENGSQD